jgi:hypothetical protein
MRQKEEFPAVGRGGGWFKMATQAILPPTQSGGFWSRACENPLKIAGFQIRWRVFKSTGVFSNPQACLGDK